MPPKTSGVVGFYDHEQSLSCSCEFAAVSGWDQLVVGPTRAHGGTIDLLMTDVPDLERVAVVEPIGNSHHSSLSAVISMTQTVPNLSVSNTINWNIKLTGIQSVEQCRIFPGVTFGLLTTLLRLRTNHCPCWLYVMYQSRSSECATWICHGLMINAGMLFTWSKRLIFVGPVIALALTGNSLSAVKWEGCREKHWRREVFSARYSPSCTLRSFLPFWKISWWLWWWLNFDGYGAIPRR